MIGFNWFVTLSMIVMLLCWYGAKAVVGPMFGNMINHHATSVLETYRVPKNCDVFVFPRLRCLLFSHRFESDHCCHAYIS